MKPIKSFGASYFKNYCKSGHYDGNFRHYSELDRCIALMDRHDLPRKSVMILGAATGRVLEAFEDAWKPNLSGCEISAWAHKQIPQRYRKKIALEDMRSYLARVALRQVRVDLVFSNSLFYIPKEDLEDVISAIARIGCYLHFNPEVEGDDWVEIDEPYEWWRERLNRQGLYRGCSPFLWRAT